MLVNEILKEENKKSNKYNWVPDTDFENYWMDPPKYEFEYKGEKYAAQDIVDAAKKYGSLYRAGAGGKKSDPIRKVIKTLQALLSKAGLKPGPIDGYYGKKTAQAVVRIQRMLGVDVDGDVGPQTAGNLLRNWRIIIYQNAVKKGKIEKIENGKPVSKAIYTALRNKHMAAQDAINSIEDIPPSHQLTVDMFVKKLEQSASILNAMSDQGAMLTPKQFVAMEKIQQWFDSDEPFAAKDTIQKLKRDSKIFEFLKSDTYKTYHAIFNKQNAKGWYDIPEEINQTFKEVNTYIQQGKIGLAKDIIKNEIEPWWIEKQAGKVTQKDLPLSTKPVAGPAITAKNREVVAGDKELMQDVDAMQAKIGNIKNSMKRLRTKLPAGLEKLEQQAIQAQRNGDYEKAFGFFDTWMKQYENWLSNQDGA